MNCIRNIKKAETKKNNLFYVYQLFIKNLQSYQKFFIHLRTIVLKSAYNLKTFPREKLFDVYNKTGGGKHVTRITRKSHI